jgi:hypothetical protein
MSRISFDPKFETLVASALCDDFTKDHIVAHAEHHLPSIVVNVRAERDDFYLNRQLVFKFVNGNKTNTFTVDESNVAQLVSELEQALNMMKTL